MIIALILAFLIGVFSVLLLEAFLLYKWWTSREVDARNVYPHRTKVSNPEVREPPGNIIGFQLFLFSIFDLERNPLLLAPS